MRLRSAPAAMALLALMGVSGCADDGYTITDSSNVLTVDPLFFGANEDFITGFSDVPFVARLGANPVAASWVSSDPSVAAINPATGVATPMSAGFTAITATVGGRQKSASLTVIAIPGIPITSGQVISGIGGVPGDLFLYRIYVPPGTTNLTATLSGGTGDLDLIVRDGAPPPLDYSEFDCAPFTGSNNESCSFDDPTTGGLFYIWVDIFAAGTGAQLVVTLTPAP